jgi:hypothetical protein
MNTISPSVSPVITAAEAVDQLGYIRAQIADLQAIEKTLKAAIEAAGIPKIEGRLYKAAVILSAGRISTDWQSVAAHFNPSRQLITAHTSQGAAFSAIRVSAR